LRRGLLRKKESKDDSVQIRKYADGTTLTVKDGFVFKESSDYKEIGDED